MQLMGALMLNKLTDAQAHVVNLLEMQYGTAKVMKAGKQRDAAARLIGCHAGPRVAIVWCVHYVFAIAPDGTVTANSGVDLDAA